MSTVPAPDPPETAVSAEWIWRNPQAGVLATEVEEFLATALPTPRRTPPRTRTLTTGSPAPDPGPATGTTVRRPPATGSSTQRSGHRTRPEGAVSGPRQARSAHYPSTPRTAWLANFLSPGLSPHHLCSRQRCQESGAAKRIASLLHDATPRRDSRKYPRNVLRAARRNGYQAADDTPHGYTVRPQSPTTNTGPVIVAGTAFTQYYDIDTSMSRRWTPSVDGGILCIDFLFPQMATPHVANPHWEPGFADYLYVSFTTATAFSPTDTMSLTRWAKMIMLLQSAISLATVALVVARAVNILK